MRLNLCLNHVRETLEAELDKFDCTMDLVPGLPGLLCDFTDDYSKMLDFFDFVSDTTPPLPQY